MSTLATVSVCQEGKVVMKIVIGSNGFNAHKLARYLRRTKKKLGLKEVYEKALSLGIGEEASLVVMGPKRTYHRCTDGPLHRRYRKTFGDPRFNPRWELGIADYTHVVNLPPRRS